MWFREGPGGSVVGRLRAGAASSLNADWVFLSIFFGGRSLVWRV